MKTARAYAHNTHKQRRQAYDERERLIKYKMRRKAKAGK